MGKRRGARGEGTVYESQGSWVASFPLGTTGGRRLRKRERHPDRAAAEAALERMRRLYGRGGSPADGTLGGYLEGWLGDVRPTVAASTWTSYAGHVRDHITPLLGGIPVQRVQPADVRRLIADRLAHTSERTGRRLSPTTVALVVTTLRIALRAASDANELEDNPAAKVRLPRRAERRVEPVTDALAGQLVAAMDGHWLGPLVRLLAGSGLRLGEALSLNQGDVDPSGRHVRVRESKTRARAVAVSRDAAEACAEAVRAAPRVGRSEPLFFAPRRNRQGHRDRLTGPTVSHALPKALEAAGLPRATPHTLRHAAATRMVAAGVHMRVVADQLGHRNPSLTARVYAHVVPGAEGRAADLLDIPPRAASDA